MVFMHFPLTLKARKLAMVKMKKMTVDASAVNRLLQTMKEMSNGCINSNLSSSSMKPSSLTS